MSLSAGDTQSCPASLLPPATLAACQEWQAARRTRYDCTSDPFLRSLPPGKHAGAVANYLSFNTPQATDHFVSRAKLLEGCTGGKIQFAEANDIAADPMRDLGSANVPGAELHDAYLMIYSFTSEASHLGLLETLNDRIRGSNEWLRYEDVFAKVQSMGEYRKDGRTNIDLLMADGDFFLPIIRIDLLEKHGFPLPHTWDDLVNITKFFNGTDLNDDGEEDYGLCIFPRTGSGFFDAWIPELMYSVWGTTDQTRGIQEGFFFDERTFEPRIGSGFERAMNVWKELWPHSADGCNTPNFVHGRCAVGFAPPGCWKGTFVDAEGGGVAWRNLTDWSPLRDADGEKLWQPRMRDGSYAEPYRMRPFGSLEVVDRATGEFKECDPAGCPKAERIKASSSLPPDDRARILVDSPHVGKLINRVPFHWSGGFGTGIRKSAAKEAKDLMWDFFAYVNAPVTSVDDVVHPSWLDAWRHSQLNDCKLKFEGDECKFVGSCNFERIGWGCTAFNEHKKTMDWALGNDVNSALTLRLPGVLTYTRDVLLDKFIEYMDGKIVMEDLKAHVRQGWIDATATRGKLDQVQIYRASLGLDPLSEFELCQLHRSDMDARDNTVCIKYDEQATDNTNVIIIGVVVPVVVIILAAAFIWIYLERKKRHLDAIWQINKDELKFDDIPEIAGRGTFGLVVKAEYRGTVVAVKRVIPPKGRANRTVGFLETDNPNTKESAPPSGEANNGATVQGKPTSKRLPGDGSTSEDSRPHPPTKRASLDEIFVDKLPEPDGEADAEKKISRAMRRLTQDSADVEAGLADIVAEHRQKRKATEGGDDDEHAKVQVVEVENAEICSPESDNGVSHPLHSVETGVTVLSSMPQSGTLSSQQSRKAKWKRWFGFKSAGKSYDQMKQDFIVEMRTLSKLRHPCITTVMGSVIDQKEEPMLVMEYMENGSLFDLLHNPSIAIEGELIGPILQDIARGARFLHAADPKVIHGDLKAANVLVDGRFHAKIADFGLSAKKKYLGASGTPYWMAPELVRKESGNSAASDVYSFGVILYELYSRQVPYEGEDPHRVLRAIANEGKRPPVPEACPPKIAEIMKECLDGNPEKRPSFEEIDLRIQRLDCDNVEPGDIIVPHQLQKKRAERNEELILQVFPKHVATALLKGKKVEPDRVGMATMFFSDIVGFTAIASRISADQVSDLLDRLYLKFDALSEKHDVFKIETIGDAYVGVCNLVKKQESDHAKRIAEFAIEAIEAAADTPVLPGNHSMGTVRIRVGVHCGPLVARVVGSRNPRYCVFGDTVNTTARMESNSIAMRIHCSDRAAEILRVQCPELPLESRGMIDIKGKGEMSTFFIVQERSKSKAFRRTTM